ncbi:GNAT family N-acetyltransferase [Deinococcus altitudinis]|uniref:GNAT family N-acetyltransferase n=1 Tax=Deinococcus altitudinis TaxID=468914 RepID=UPI003891ACBF
MLRPYAPHDAPEFLCLLNLARAQSTALESFLSQEAVWPAEHVRRRAVAVHEDVVVGMAELSRFEYLPPGWLRLTLAVNPRVRQQGLGAELYRWVQAQAEHLRPGGLSVSILDHETGSRDWAERHGFVLHAHRFASELDLGAEFPPPELPAGVTLRDMVGASPADWDRLETLYGDLLTQTPDLEGQPRWTPEQLRSNLRDNPRARPDWTLVAVDGAGGWLGLCQGATISTGIYNEFTAVLPAARGQGLARALKLELIRRAQAAGVRLMRTNNHAANAPMLGVNRRLGFVAQSGSWELRQELE